MGEHIIFYLDVTQFELVPQSAHKLVPSACGWMNEFMEYSYIRLPKVRCYRH